MTLIQISLLALSASKCPATLEASRPPREPDDERGPVFGRGRHVHRPSVRVRELSDNEEAEPEAARGVARRTCAAERIEE